MLEISLEKRFLEILRAAEMHAKSTKQVLELVKADLGDGMGGVLIQSAEDAQIAYGHSDTPALRRLVQLIADLTVPETLTFVAVLKLGQYDEYTWDKAVARATRYAFLDRPEKIAEYGALHRRLRVGLERLGVDPQ